MEMSGYRRVNYYELCRLCTSSEGTKMHIFREEGRRRSLPNKIQTCLPLTVQENDSLPKIICSVCVEKLESFFEFRESCVNAEAMLESYFTSLRYSDDLSREGKVSVYVKEEPSKKKEDCNTPKSKPALTAATTNVNTSSASAISNVNAASTVSSDAVGIPSAIQILTDQDGNRLAQYKVQVQGGIPSLIPSFSAVQVPVPTLQPMKTMSLSQDGNQATQTDNSQPPPLMAAVTLSQPHDIFNTAAKDRYRGPLTQISEALKMKNISVIDASIVEQLSSIAGAPGSGGVQFRIDPDQLQQLMTTGGNLQLNLNTITSTKIDRREKEDQNTEADMELKFDEEPDPTLENDNDNDNDIGDVGGDLTDGEGQSFDCELCGKIFRRKEHLLQHKKSHSGQRPYACSMCGKAFSRKEHLLRHKVSHTGQKLYTCDVCQKNFSRKDNLHKHKKTHGINGPHVCDVCGKSFVVKHYYTIHRATHNRDINRDPKGTTAATTTQTNPTYQCDICAKYFSSKYGLDIHKQRHKAKVKVEEEIPEQQQPQQQQQQQQQQHTQQQHPTIIASFPMTTINHQSLLNPNILHAAGNMVQIGNASYVCSPELIDQYRRLHSS